MKRSFVVLAAGLLTGILSAPRAHAQEIPAATRGGVLQVGVGYANGQTDEFEKRITGYTIYADFDFTRHLGVEFDAHLLTVVTPNDYAQKSYLGGIRYVYRKNRFEPYGKVMAGIGQSIAQESYLVLPGTPGTYGIYALGAGLDIQIPKHLTVRAVDFEYQKWPGFVPNGLNPSVLSFGVAYRIR